MTTDDGPALKPSDEAVELVRAYQLAACAVVSESRVTEATVQPYEEAKAALLAFIARLEEEAATPKGEAVAWTNAQELTLMNHGEEGVMWRSQNDSRGKVVMPVALYLAAPPHADLVAEEREACAQLARSRAASWRGGAGKCSLPLEEECEDIAAAIRARAALTNGGKT